MKTTVEHFCGDEVFQVKDVGNKTFLPHFWDLTFGLKHTPREKRSFFSGAGLYLISYDHLLLYVGKFLGKRDNPFAGDIRSARWSKHLATLTNRGRNLSFSLKAQAQIEGIVPQIDSVSTILAVNRKILAHDRGCQSTYNRLRFALNNWSTFANPLSEKVLNKFKFTFVKVHEDSVGQLGIESIRGLISEAEELVVDKITPPCNAAVGDLPLDIVAESLVDCVALTQNALELSFNKLNMPKVMHNEVILKSIPEEENMLEQHESTEPEDRSAEEAFNEKMAKAPKVLTDLIADVISMFGPQHDVDVHYTFVEKGQMRLRVFAEGLRRDGQNFASLTYRPMSETIQVNIKSDSPIPTMFETMRGSGALSIGLKVSASLNGKGKMELLKCLAKSKELISGKS